MGINIDKRYKWGPQGINRKFKMGGWYGEARRHSLAALGIKTGTKTKVKPVFGLLQRKVRSQVEKPLFIEEPFGIPPELRERDKYRDEYYIDKLGRKRKFQAKKSEKREIADAMNVRSAMSGIPGLSERQEFNILVDKQNVGGKLTEQEEIKIHGPKKMMFRKLKESDLEKIREFHDDGVNIDNIKFIFSDADPNDVQSAFDKARSDNRLDVQRQQAKGFGSDLELKESGITSVGPFLSAEEASQRAAHDLREAGTSKKGFGGLTASNVRKIIHDAEFKPNPYAVTYINSLDDAEAMGGAHGVASQIGYILSNLRVKGDRQKEAKKQLKDLWKEAYG